MGLWNRERRLPPVWLFVVLGAIVVPGFGFATCQVWSNDVALRDRGQGASAVVTTRSGKSRLHVEYTTRDGRRVGALVGQGDEAPGERARPGETIPIVYDPEHPTADVRDARSPENHRIAYLLLGVTVAAAVAVPLAARQLARAHRRRAG